MVKKWHSALYILLFYSGLAQNKVIEFSDMDSWPSLIAPSLSPDGQYAAYMIKSNGGKVKRLCVRSLDGTDSIDVINISTYNFAMDSRHLVYSLEGDNSISIVNLKSGVTYREDSILSYDFIKDKPNDWIVIRKEGLSEKMVAINLKSGKRLEYDSIGKIHLMIDGCRLVVEQNKHTAVDSKVQLLLLNLKDGTKNNVWTGIKISAFEFDSNLLRCYVRNQGPNGADFLDVYTITGYGLNRLCTKMLDSLRLIIDGIKVPNTSSQYVFFYARDPLDDGSYSQDTVHTNVRIWSYLDQQLKTLRDQTTSEPKSYLYAMSIIDGKVKRIEYPNEESYEIDSLHMLIRKWEGDCHLSEVNWNKACSRTYYLVSTTDFSRIVIPELSGQDVSVSPGGKYLSYYDFNLGAYCLYNVKSRLKYPITLDVKKATWDRYYNKGVLRRIAGWLPHDNAVLINDSYDIYMFDPEGKKPAKCITGHLGEKTKTVFALTYSEPVVRWFKNKNEFLLTALNTINKDNGFYKVSFSGNLEVCTIGPYIYDVGQLKSGTEFPPSECNFTPLQAKFANVFMVKRTSASEFGNFYLTKDFKTFKKISDLHPERGYNWYTSELHSWKSLDSTVIQGILYKPYDFDSTKKYPLLFHYYDRKSDALNAYITPAPLQNGASINIPYYVSRGYLVALVDIHFKVGFAGRSAVASLESAVKYFSQFKYIDSGRLGIEGFSFGGYLTYYLVTHTNIFAAASAGAGATDIISHFGTLKNDVYPAHELAQYRIGKMLWERPDIFVENSPVMVSKNVTTPLLMMNNTHDGAVNIRQAIEFFTALRIQGKRVWFLEYLRGDHGVSGEDALDYCNRQLQFFDHYLKGRPMPKWMTKEN